MNILLIAIGSRGDVQPFVVLGQALAARGHDVAIAASKGFAAMIHAAKLDHCVLPMDFQELLQQPEMKDALNSVSGKLKAVRWSTKALNDQFDAIWALGQERRPDLILHHFKSGIATYLARKLGAISIPVMLQPGFTPTHEYPQFMISSHSLGRFGNLASHHILLALTHFGTNMMIKRWRKASNPDIGDPMDTLQGYNPHAQPIRIHAYSKVIVPRPAEWPATEVQTGYLFAEPQTYQPSDALSAFLDDGPPPVYFGFGSMPGMDPQRNADAVSGALEKSGVRAVVATGWGGLSHLKASSNVHILDAAPHTYLFPKMAAVVHHGGSGTTHEGLRWGQPSVICPLFADQPFFGQRIADLGAGPPPIHQKRLTADGLSKSLEIALSEPVALKAAKIGEAMQQEDGVREVCDLVDQSL